eukprot:3388720-Pyramimonas_sp.AAC.1
MDAPAFARLGHRMFFICLRCKNYTGGGQVRGLRQQCSPLPAVGAQGRRYAWKLIRAGSHPKRSGVT